MILPPIPELGDYGGAAIDPKKISEVKDIKWDLVVTDFFGHRKVLLESGDLKELKIKFMQVSELADDFASLGNTFEIDGIGQIVGKADQSTYDIRFFKVFNNTSLKKAGPILDYATLETNELLGPAIQTQIAFDMLREKVGL